VQPARLSQKRDFGLWNDDHRSSSTYSDIALVCGSVRPRGVWTTAFAGLASPIWFRPLPYMIAWSIRRF